MRLALRSGVMRFSSSGFGSARSLYSVWTAGTCTSLLWVDEGGSPRLGVDGGVR